MFGRFVAPYSPTEFVGPPFSLPAAAYWLGTDFLGRDVLTRVLYGGLSVFVLGIAATAIGIVLGVSLGLISGYARRWIDESIMRMLDVVLAFPSIVLAMLFVSILGPRLWLIVLMVGISHMPRIARVTRAATVELAARDFVRAAGGPGRAATQDPPLRGPAQHQQSAARGVRPAPHLLHHHDRGAFVHRFRHAAARPRIGV